MMRAVLLAAFLAFIAAPTVRATEALEFSGGGYELSIVIGMAPGPVVASVRFTPPGAKEWIHVPREHMQIKKFDMRQQALLIRFVKGKHDDPGLPDAFTFSARKKSAVLSVGGKEIKGSFSWLDDI